MILAAALNSNSIQPKAIAPPDATLAKLPQGVASPKLSVFSKALAAAASSKRPEKAKNDAGVEAPPTNLPAPAPAPAAIAPAGVNTIGLTSPPILPEPTSATGDDPSNGLAVGALASSTGLTAVAAAASPAFGILTKSSAATPASLAAFAPEADAQPVQQATALAAELQANDPARGAVAGVPGADSADSKLPVRPVPAVSAGTTFDTVNSLPARIANPIVLKNATTSLESFASLVTRLAKPVVAAASTFDERFEGNAQRAVREPRDTSSQNADSGGVPGSSTTTSVQVSAESQRVISDARRTLVGQLESKLESEVGASAPISADALSGIDKQNAGQGPTSQQSGTPSNSQGNAGQNGSDSQAGSSADADNSAAPLAAVDVAAAIKSAAVSAASAVTSAHSLESAGAGTFGAALATSAASAVPSSSGGSATAEKPALPSAPPLLLPFAEAARPADAVKASEIYQRVDGSEMHVAMQTDLLGAVDLRATIHQSGLTATISVQRPDVQSLLSSELPALQHTLSDRNLHVEQISILNNSVHERGGGSGAAPQQQNPNGGKATTVPQPLRAGESLREELGATSSADGVPAGSAGHGRISVHA